MSTRFPERLYTCKQTRALDSAAINDPDSNIPSITLMKRAGRAAFEMLMRTWPETEKIIVLCGSGNNGGDGYIVAALAAQRKIPVVIYSTVNPESLEGDAKRSCAYAQQEGVEIQSTQDLDIEGYNKTVIVDALLGIGFHGELRPEVGAVTRIVNASDLPVLSLDIPTGLNGDTGLAAEDTIKADHTITFVARKQGLFTGQGPAYCGAVSFDDLNIPAFIYDQAEATCSLVKEGPVLAQRSADSHKGLFGHVMVIGGDLGMGGAALLACEAALRSGAGLVSLATRPEHVAPALARLPEVMTLGVNGAPELEGHIKKASVIVVGPGLGTSAWSQQLLRTALHAKVPLVMDADALNLLAQHYDITNKDLTGENDEQGKYLSKEYLAELKPDWVLTPHPGEASRLLACETSDITHDRFDAVNRLQQKFKAVTVLKGAGSLIASDAGVTLANVGNPGMAVAGMGDVLSGVIAAFIAQGHSLTDAAIAGVCCHGQAGDRAAKEGLRGIRASDLMPFIRQGANGDSTNGESANGE